MRTGDGAACVHHGSLFKVLFSRVDIWSVFTASSGLLSVSCEPTSHLY